MSVERFRSALDMPAPVPRDLVRSMAAVWERANMHGRPSYPSGVFKYRSTEEAHAAREQRESDRQPRLFSQGEL